MLYKRFKLLLLKYKKVFSRKEFFMSYLEKYNEWLNDPAIDEETKKELRSIKDDETEIQDRFYKDLTFGTGGLRGIIGAGTNRINVYTIAKATQGLANYLKKNFLLIQ